MKSMLKLVFYSVCLVSMSLTSIVMAQDSLANTEAQSSVVGEEFNWKNTLEWDADVRLRFETIQVDGSESRNRSRIRARFAVDMQATESIDFGVRIATGDGNPRSTNISFDDGFSLKQIGLDRAFVTWHATENIDVIGGKMKIPWFIAGSNSMHFDSDLNPEGAALKYQSSDGMFFGSLGAFSIAERSSSDDSLMFSAQGGYKMDLGGNSKLKAAIGYFDYTNTIGNAPFYLGNDSGNSVDANGNLLYDYDILEFGIAYSTTIGDLPVTAFAVTAKNGGAPNEDTAFAFGFSVSDLMARANLDLSYAYHDTDADGVIGTFIDSDFAGGQSDSNGHFIKARYALRDNIDLGATLNFAERGAFSGNEVNYDRIQLDFVVAFE